MFFRGDHEADAEVRIIGSTTRSQDGRSSQALVICRGSQLQPLDLADQPLWTGNELPAAAKLDAYSRPSAPQAEAQAQRGHMFHRSFNMPIANYMFKNWLGLTASLMTLYYHTWFILHQYTAIIGPKRSKNHKCWAPLCGAIFHSRQTPPPPLEGVVGRDPAELRTHG